MGCLLANKTSQGVPGYLQALYVGTCYDSFSGTSDLGVSSVKSPRVNNTHTVLVLWHSLFEPIYSHVHTYIYTQRTHPSIISWAIHCSGLHTEWTHSSHNYCGGSHTLHQSIPVSKSPGENSERIRFPKDIMRFLYLHLRRVKREEQDLQSIKVTSWLIHTSVPRPYSWKRRIQGRRMLASWKRLINL